MKAKLTFNLDEPDDRMAHQRCVKALDMAIVLFRIKYNMQKDLGLEDNQTADKIFYAIGNEMFDKGINLDDLIE